MPALSNSKHEAVLAAYLKDKSRVGWKAYQLVYAGSSQRAAETGWSRLLKVAEFKSRHDALLNSVTEQAVSAAVMDLNEVLEELSKLGRSSIQNAIVRGDDTRDVVQALANMDPVHAAAIQELTVETYVEGAGENARDVKRVKIKLHDKKGALSELRRHFEPDKLEHTGKDGKPIQTEQVGEALSELDLARRIAFALELGARGAAAAPAVGSKAKAKPGKRGSSK